MMQLGKICRAYPCRLIPSKTANTMTSSYHERIDRVIAHVRQNLGRDLSLDALSDVAALSRFHFHRVFTAMTGETVADAVRRARLNRASQLLVATTRPLASIAAEVGYPNTDSFARAYRDAFGHPPGETRRHGVTPVPLLPKHKGVIPMHDVTVQTLPDTRLAALAHTGPYIQIGASFGRLMDEIENAGLMHRLAGPALGVYYDDPSTIPAAELRAHAGMQLSDRQPIPDTFEDVTLPGGRHAVLVLKGPYTGIPAAWTWLYGTWFPASGEDPADRAPFEVYRNSMADTAPSNLITEICVPLR
jgi:AraC family transcriptional regulator